MCGLVGIWRRDGGEADRNDIERMLAPIAHRGPDGRGIWQNGHVAFGHLRLSIIDLTDASAQPMLTADRSGVLVYNGEVYNYRDLRTELEREGVRFHTSGEVEVVLLALHHWGAEEAVKRFNGMFALAYFDGRDGAVWLARDRVGIKPMLVADTGTEFVFGSEAKALLAHPRMKVRADRHAMSKWLLSGGYRPDRTLFEGIDAVEAGSLWKITKHGIEKRRYFDVLEALDVDRLVRASSQDPESFVRAFRDLLYRNVGLHLISDAPLAAACSGGVDSSLITTYAHEHMPGIAAYVADVAWSKSEGDQAERVGQHLGVHVNRIKVDQARFLELWPKCVWHSDVPSTTPSDPAMLAVTLKCRADGIKVLLTGEGSDELFGGYNWLQATYTIWARQDSWRRYFAGKNGRSRAYDFAPFSNTIARSNRSLRERMTIALDAEDELLPQRILAHLDPVKPDADRAFLAHCLWSLSLYLSWILHRHDRIGMAASIEMRVPFLENDMFDFAFHLPRRAKLHRGVGKWLVKQAAAEVLPRDIVYAGKRGFPMPLKFCRGTEGLLAGGMLCELMEWPAGVTRDTIDMIGASERLRYHVVGLELWARMFFRGEAPEALSDRLATLAHDHASKRRVERRQRRGYLAALAQRARRALRGSASG